MKEARLVVCDGEAAIRKPHAALEEQTAQRCRATKLAIDFRIQSANKRKTERHPNPKFLEHVEPRSPTVNDDVVRLLTVQSTRDPRKGTQSIESSARVEPASRENSYFAENDTIWLTRIGRYDDDVVSAGYQLERKQGDLKLGAAGGMSGGRVERQVSVPGQEKEFHAGRLIERAGFPATTSPGATS